MAYLKCPDCKGKKQLYSDALAHDKACLDCLRQRREKATGEGPTNAQIEGRKEITKLRAITDTQILRGHEKHPTWSDAAKELGISRQAFGFRAKKLGLKPDNQGRPTGSTGRRQKVSDDQVREAFAQADSYGGAAKTLGIAYASAKKRATKLGLKPGQTPAAVKKRATEGEETTTETEEAVNLEVSDPVPDDLSEEAEAQAETDTALQERQEPEDVWHGPGAEPTTDMESMPEGLEPAPSGSPMHSQAASERPVEPPIDHLDIVQPDGTTERFYPLRRLVVEYTIREVTE